MPTKSALVDLNNFQSQAARRSVVFFYDQHRNPKHPIGRAWWANVEPISEGSGMPGPCHEMLPVSADKSLDDGNIIAGWNSPWYPEATYMMHSIGGRRGQHFEIRYDRMAQEYRTANDDYYRAAARIAAHKGWPMPQLYQAVDWQIVAVLGEPPRSPKIPEAAMAGDQWLLGFREEPNETLAALLYAEDVRMAPRPVEVAHAVNDLVSLTPDQLDERIATAVATALQRERDARAAKMRAAKGVKHSTKAAA